jgi:glycerate dehydrogenase
MDRQFATSDVISLHCPLTKDNAEFVNRRLLDSVKASAFLINTARGQLIDEVDLAAALNNNQLRGAALDVLSTEPPKASNPLLRAPNCIVTPHNAWMSLEARTRMMEITLKNIEAFLSGKPVNVVSG